VEVRKLRLNQNLMIHAVVEVERSIRTAAAKKGEKPIIQTTTLFLFEQCFLIARRNSNS